MPIRAGIFSLSMSKRLAMAMAVLASSLLLVTSLGTVHALRVADEQAAMGTVGTLARSYARELRTRLTASEQVVQSMTSGDAGPGGAELRAHLLRSDIFRGVVVDGPGKAQAPLPLTPADQLALSAGQTLLRARRAGSVALYLVHAVRAGGSPALAYFELNGDWLWQGSDDAAPASGAYAVLDGSGAPLRASEGLPADLLPLYARERASAAQSQSGPALRSWNVARREWRGAVMTVLPEDAHLAGGHWAVIASLPLPSAWDEWAQAALMLPVPMLLAAFLVIASCALLRSRWEPVLDALRGAIGELAAGRYQRVPTGEARDAPRAAAVAFNRTIGVLEEKMRALASLNDIDRMLLESAELESCLDPLLDRICKITACDAAMLALLDPDATDYGRAYLTAAGQHAPVSRISLDPLLLSQLCQEHSGLTVGRFEPGRHSVLEPLRAQGAEFFWLWPVISQDKLVAVLAVGYRDVPQVAAEVAGYGTECAARIGVALSNNARGEQLYRQAHFDPLTALPNRLLFRDRLSQELASAAAGRQRGALLYVDLDHFKKINDTVGHSAGDQMLQIVAQRLRACVKEGDTVARLGGDEFTIILRSVSSAESVQRVAARVIEVLQEAVNIGGRDHHAGASIGITMFPDDGTAIDELMRNADLAMYRAKADGRARAVFYTRSMQRMPALAAESGLYNALQRREFSLYYQPQYALADGALVGLEALLRWQPPREPMRFPGQFVPAAEQSGLIVDIGAWVLEAACAQMADWAAAGIAPPRVALNVSVHQLRQADFPKLVRRALEHAGVAPDKLEFELTESVFADEEALATLHRLASLGVHLSLDDFGTGYSSLGYLRAHPVQAIKIDRSFIEEVAHNVTAATLAETMITMAHALGKRVVAEGVETMEQLEFLRARHCDYAQGFYFARPAAAADITALLEGRSATAITRLRAAG
ncbi:MAG TPA: EAL domain-containing protein [Steroidobacteraceae bacterium]|nr:EAL domain-containing protein [Steroidobacteraceae bacterium]